MRVRTVGIAVGVVILLAMGVPLAAMAALDGGLLSGPLEKLASAKLGRPVRFGRITTHLLSSAPTFAIENLVVGSPPQISREDLLHASRVSGQARLLPLFAGRLVLTRLQLDDVDLNLVRLGRGRNNYTFGSGGAGGALRSVASLSIPSGKVRFEDPERQATLVGGFVHAAGPGTRLPLSVSGAGLIQGGQYRLEARGGALNGRAPQAPYPFDAAIQDGAMRLRFTGTTQKPFDFRGFDFGVQASGPNLANLRHLFGALAPNSPRFSLTARVRREGHAVRISRIDGVVGGSDVRGDIFTDHPPNTRRIVRVVLRSRTLRLADVRTMLQPTPPHAVTRVDPGTAPLQPRPRSARVFSEQPFKAEALRRTDLDLDLRAAATPDAPIPVADLALRLKLVGGDLALAPVSFRTGAAAPRAPCA